MKSVSSVQSRVKTGIRNQNSEQRADEGSAMLTVASANVRTLPPKQGSQRICKDFGITDWSRSSPNLGLL